MRTRISVFHNCFDHEDWPIGLHWLIWDDLRGGRNLRFKGLKLSRVFVEPAKDQETIHDHGARQEMTGYLFSDTGQVVMVVGTEDWAWKLTLIKLHSRQSVCLSMKRDKVRYRPAGQIRDKVVYKVPVPVDTLLVVSLEYMMIYVYPSA